MSGTECYRTSGEMIISVVLEEFNLTQHDVTKYVGQQTKYLGGE